MICPGRSRRRTRSFCQGVQNEAVWTLEGNTYRANVNLEAEAELKENVCIHKGPFLQLTRNEFYRILFEEGAGSV